MPIVQITNPYGKDTEAVTQEFPDFYTTSMMEDEVRTAYPDKVWPTVEPEKVHPQGVLSEFAEAFGDSWDQAQYDLAIGSAILRSDEGETFALLEEEYSKWKESPDDYKEYDILSGGFVGQAFGGVARDVIAGIGTGVVASTVATPAGGLYTGAATVATLQGTTAKGGSMRNSYIAIRNEMEQKGEIDLEKAYETARRISNTDAMLAVGEAGLATLVPVARMTPGIGRSALSQAATKGAAELGFDASVGATGSVLSDVYAESEGVNRGDKFENALRAGLQEVIGGGVPSALRTYGEYKNIKMQRKTVADMLKEGEDVKRLDYTEFGNVPSTPPVPFGPTYRMDAETSAELVPTPTQKQEGFDWSGEDLDGTNWDFLEAPETRPLNDPESVLKERLRQGNVEKGRKAVVVPVFDDEGNLISMRKATRSEVEEIRKQGKNPVLVSENLNKVFTQENGAGGRVVFREPGGRIFEIDSDGTIPDLTPTEWDPFLASDGNVLPFNEAVIPDQEIEPSNLTWRDVLTAFPEELSSIENVEVMTGGVGGEIASVLKRELLDDPRKQEAIFRTGKYGELSDETVAGILDQNVPNDLDILIKNRLTALSKGVPDFKKQRYFETDTGKIAIPFSNFGHALAGTKDSNKDLASQIGSQERLDSILTAIDSRMQQIKEGITKKISDKELNINRKVPAKTGTAGFQHTTISKQQDIILKATRDLKETPQTRKVAIKKLKERIENAQSKLDYIYKTAKLKDETRTPLPKNEHAILFEFLSDPVNPSVGPYSHENDPAGLTEEIDGVKYLKDSNEVAALTALKSAVQGVQYDVRVSQLETISAGIDENRITATQAMVLANQYAGLAQENQNSIDLGNLSDALASEDPLATAEIITKPIQKDLPFIDLQKFKQLAEDETTKQSNYGDKAVYSVSGSKQISNYSDAVLDEQFRRAFFADLNEVKSRLNQIEKFKWFANSLEDTINRDRKGKKVNLLKDVRVDLFNIDGINTIEDLIARNKELEGVAKKYKSWGKVKKPLDNWLLSQKSFNDKEVDDKAAAHFKTHNYLKPDQGIYEIGQTLSYADPNIKDNHFNRSRRAARELLTALRNLNKLDGVLYSNGLVNFAAVGQVFKALVKLGIALSASGVNSLSNFAKAIRQSPDNEAVKTAWNDVQTGKVRTVESFSERVVKAILELIKKRQISKAEQWQVSSMEDFVSSKWERFLEDYDLQQYKDEGITPPIKALVKRYMLNEYVDLPHIMARIAAGRPVSTPEIEDVIKKIPDSRNAWYLLDGLETVMAEKGIRMDEFQDQFMQAMLDAKVDPKKFTDYLIAKHASERNAQVAKINPKEFGDPENKGGSGMSNKDARKIIEDAKSENKQQAYEALYAEYLKPVMDKTLTTALNAGLIDQENYERLRTVYQYYVPLRGKEGSDSVMFGTGNGIDVRGEEFKRALGRTSKTNIVIPYIFQQYNNMLLRAERVKVMKALAEFAQANPNEDIKLADPNYVRKLVESKGISYVKHVQNPQWTNDTDLVGFKVNGKQYYLKFKNKALAHSLRNQGVSGLGAMLRGIGRGTKFLSRMNTQYNVGFTLPNFARDILFAKINLSSSGQQQMARDLANIWNLPGMPATMAGKKKGQIFMALAATSRAESPGVLGKTLTRMYADGKSDSDWDAAYKELKQYGGRIQFRGITDIDTRMDDLNQLSKKIDKLDHTKDPKSKKAAVMALGKGVKTFIEELNSSVESATRLATYKLARENGATPLQAAYLSRNITINFTRRGKAGAGLNNLFMFYNASAQGSYQVLSNMWHTKNGKDIAFQIAFTGFSVETFNQMFSGEDEDGVSFYEKIPEWKKATNFIIMNPVTGKDAIAFPLPYGYNVLHYMGQKASRVAKGGYLGSDKLPGTQSSFSAAADITGAAFDAFNPIGGSTSIARAITPDLGDIFIDLYANKDWKGDKIMPETSPFDPYPKPDSEKYWSTVNPWIRDFTRTLNTMTGGNTVESGLVDWSPETVEAMLGHFLGGAGQTAFRFIDLVKPETWKDGVPPTNDWPIARRFVSSPNAFYSLEKFKEVRALSKRAIDTHSMYVQNRDQDSAKEFKKQNEILFKINPYVKKTESRMRSINKTMRKISASYGLSEEDKAIRLAKLKMQKLSAMQDTHSKYIKLLETLD